MKCSIIGATGYAGVELVRLLDAHPHAELSHLVSKSYAGKTIDQIYPHFTKTFTHTLVDMNLEKIANESDVIFTALPHGASADVVATLYASGKKIIDLSADFRYQSPQVYEQWYGVPHPYPQLLKDSVYGLPELHRAEIPDAKIIGNPGCYTTCSILGLAPLIKDWQISLEHIIIDAKSGVSGAGRGMKQNLQFCEVNESAKAYSIGTHRHTSEIEQELSLLAGDDVVLSFTPHLLPISRGILSTIYADLQTKVSTADILALYHDFYNNEPFVRVYELGNLPEIKNVVGSNYCDIGIVIDERLNRVVVVSTIDNLIKGAAGQAVQNMNILFGLNETTGLSSPGWYL